MKKFNIYLLGILSVITFLTLTSSIDKNIFNINKSFEIFGSVFKHVALNYVEEIAPEELIKSSIDGLLENLDPFTEYYTQSEVDDIDFLITGTYTGLGISVGIRDSMMTIVGLRDGYSARKSGIRIGDRLYKIDTTIVINKSTKELRQFTRGEPGSFCDFYIIRDGITDTLKFRLERENIQIQNVSFSGFIKKNVAYIKLERFSRNCESELRAVINKLSDKDTIKSLILDLRDNPGGLLESAISICELFVPKGSVIVKTKGRNKSDEIVYRSHKEPLLPYQPLAILINENSASASEIVAGAIQDLDRGIIIGRRSYGKGLVQSVFDIPYKGSIKLTTAKYYTPSGRCIQKLDYVKNSRKNETFPSHDTTIFYTQNGRRVYEYVGIIPDTIIEPKEKSNFINELLNTNKFFNFANIYTAKLKKLDENFSIDERIISEFEAYLKTQNIDYTFGLNKKLEDIKTQAKMDKYSDRIINTITQLQNELKKEKPELIKNNIWDIKKYLELEIKNRFLTEEEYIKHTLITDEIAQAALNLITSDKYYTILALNRIDKNKQ